MDLMEHLATALVAHYSGGPMDGKQALKQMDELQRPTRMQMLGDACGQCHVKPILQDGHYVPRSVMLQWQPLPAQGAGVHGHAGEALDDPTGDVAWLEQQAVDVHRTFGVGWRVALLGYPNGPEFDGNTLHDAATKARAWVQANPAPAVDPALAQSVLAGELPMPPMLGNET